MKKILLFITLFCSFSLYGQSFSSHLIGQAIRRQLADFPKSTLQDIYKSFYQEHYGPEHMISDSVGARQYLFYELSHMTDTASMHFEPTGCQGDYIRVYFSAITDGIITADQLLDAFLKSADSRTEPQIDWAEKWSAILRVIEEENIEIEGSETDSPILTEAAKKHQPMHHSRIYNQFYHPHYRIVERSILEQLLGHRNDY